MASITGGELLIRTLKQAGVRNVFGLHGAHLETLFQACVRHGIRITDTRTEAAAGHAAEGYARSARTLGVAMVTAGPGFTNAITSIANAYLDRTPVLYLSGSAALRDAETNTLQAGIDQVAIARPITRWAHQITTSSEIPRLVCQAIRVATSGARGPVLLDLPMDVLTATIDDVAISLPDTIAIDSPPAPNALAIEQAIRLLAGARRPIAMAGAGAYWSDAGEELRRFAETSGVPVYSDFQAHGLIPSSHPLYGGTFHKLADLAAEEERPDVVLALGVRFGLFTLGRSERLVPARARIIHVELDPVEIGRLRDVAVSIVADPRETLHALNVAASAVRWPDRSDWQRRIRDARAAHRERLSGMLTRSAPPIHPYQAVATIIDEIGDDAIVVGDGAESYHWLNEVIRQSRPGSYITHGFLGAVGFGMGLAIGAQVASPARRVVCIAGDGAIGFSLAEFDTLARHQLPVVAIVMNNRSWGASQHFQEIVSGVDHLIGTRLGHARYADVAAALGCHAQHVTDVGELTPAIRAALASGKPACIDVAIDVAPIPPEVGLLMSRQ
jgi:acetolactate synthase-1/2/3 large subunit